MIRYMFHHKKVSPMEGFTLIDNRKSSLDHRMWSELAGMKLLYDKFAENDEIRKTKKDPEEIAKYTNPDWISLNHYRRIFDPDMYNRTCIPQPMLFNCSLAQNYAYYHNVEDLKICAEALSETYPHLMKQFEQVINGNMFIPYIICNCHINTFKDYWIFLYTVLSKYLEKVNVKTYEDMIERVKNVEGYSVERENRNNKVEYQARVPSFLAERLGTLYWNVVKTQTPVFPAKVLLLEDNQKI